MKDGSETRTGGAHVVDALCLHGVDTAFCVPGESYLAVLDALHDARNVIRLVTCRHENGAANMAEAYGKLTGKPGVCLVTRGPGACNASIGVHTAFQDSTPMVLLIGQIPRPFAGREAFQEVDYRRMFAPLAKWVEQAESAADLPDLMARAFHAAVSGRPGPAVLALPEDVLGESVEAARVPPLSIERARPASADMDRLGVLLGKAQRPIMIVGGGGWTEEARDGALVFAEANDLAVCCSFRRHDIFDNGHPSFIGDLGTGPNPELVARVKAADLVLAVGARLGEITTQGYTLIGAPRPEQTLVHVHAGAEELGRVFTAELAIHSGMAEFVAAAAELKPADTPPWRDGRAAARREYEEGLVPPPSDGRLDLGAVMGAINERLTADAILTTDAGNFSGWVHRFVGFGGGRRFLGATNGAMGYGVPSAVAAKITAPERMVIGFVGDGGFGMTGQELATAVVSGAAPLIIVFNNSMYGTIRMHQERDYPERVIATDLANPDYAALAVAHGAFGEAVERTEDFAPALDRALVSGKAALIELRTDPNIITTRTTLATIRAKALVDKV
jgi:acetolactate synthase-1/2/3 large subunit